MPRRLARMTALASGRLRPVFGRRSRYDRPRTAGKSPRYMGWRVVPGQGACSSTMSLGRPRRPQAPGHPCKRPFAKAADFVEFFALRAILNKSSGDAIFEGFPNGTHTDVRRNRETGRRKAVTLCGSRLDHGADNLPRSPWPAALPTPRGLPDDGQFCRYPPLRRARPIRRPDRNEIVELRAAQVPPMRAHRAGAA
jgi:hypothetical protein